MGKKRTGSGNSYYRDLNITLRRKPADVLMVRYVQEKWKNFNLVGKQMITTFKSRIFPVNIKVCKCGLRISNDRKKASLEYCAGNTVRNISLHRSY